MPYLRFRSASGNPKGGPKEAPGIEGPPYGLLAQESGHETAGARKQTVRRIFVAYAGEIRGCSYPLPSGLCLLDSPFNRGNSIVSATEPRVRLRNRVIPKSVYLSNWSL